MANQERTRQAMQAAQEITGHRQVVMRPERHNIPEKPEGATLTQCPICGRECWKMPLEPDPLPEGFTAACTSCALKMGGGTNVDAAGDSFDPGKRDLENFHQINQILGRLGFGRSPAETESVIRACGASLSGMVQLVAASQSGQLDENGGCEMRFWDLIEAGEAAVHAIGDRLGIVVCTAAVQSSDDTPVEGGQ